MLTNGQEIDLTQVDALLNTVTEQNKKSLAEINSIHIVQEFQSIVDAERIRKFIEPVERAMKRPKYAGYKNNIAMRTFAINHNDGTSHERLTARDLASMTSPTALAIIAKDFTNPLLTAAADAFEEAECLRQNTNANRIDKLNNPGKYIQLGFNPFNYSQLTKMWLSFGLESDVVSKDTGEMSFNADVLKELSMTTSGDIQRVIRLYLEIAESKNMVTQYLPKYYGSTVDGRVYGNLRLQGTVSGRLSGKAPKMKGEQQHKCGINLVTQPSSNPIFGSTVKKMFTAPKGKLLVQIDFS